MSHSEQSGENLIPDDLAMIATWTPFKLFWLIESKIFSASQNDVYRSALHNNSENATFNNLLQGAYQARQSIEDAIATDFTEAYKEFGFRVFCHRPPPINFDPRLEVNQLIQLVEKILQTHLPSALENGEQLCRMASSSNHELKALLEAGYQTSLSLANILEWIEIWLERNRL
jgi:hypothetical protein